MRIILGQLFRGISGDPWEPVKKKAKQDQVARSLLHLFEAKIWCAVMVAVNLWWLVEPPQFIEGTKTFFMAWQVAYLGVLVLVLWNLWSRALNWAFTLLLMAFVVGDGFVLYYWGFLGDNVLMGTQIVLVISLYLCKPGALLLLVFVIRAEMLLKSWRVEYFSELLAKGKSPEEAQRRLKLAEENRSP